MVYWQESEEGAKFELKSKIGLIVLQGEKNDVCCKQREHVLLQGGIQVHDRTVCSIKN